ncbi:MAG: YfhO family protein [Thermoanaerobaculia bacterium]
MWLVVLRSLAVYGGTAALLLYLAHRFVLPLTRRTALLLALAPLLFTGRAILTGGVFAPLDIAYQAEPLRSRRAELGIVRTWNPLTVDVVSQMLPWRKAVRDALENGRLPLWNPHLLAGAPLLAVQQPAVLHPGTWIGLLLPLPQAWTFDMTLRFLLGLLSGYLFFRGTRASETAALFGAAAWAFSDFLIFFVGYPVTPSVAPFPLLLLGLARLAERGARRDAGVTAAALVAIVIAGHPETLLFCVAGGGIFFLFELARAGPGRWLRPVLLSFAAGALALGLTAVLLAPFLEILSQTWQYALRTLFYARGRRSEELAEVLRRLTSSAVPYAWGALGRSRVVERLIVPAGYAGSLLLPFAAAGLGAPSRRKWAFVTMGLFGLAVNARLWGVTNLLAQLPLFDIAVCDYLVFLWVFALAALAVSGLDQLREGRGFPLFAAGAVAATLAAVLVASVRGAALRDLGMSAGYLRLRILLQVVPVLLALGIVLLSARGRPLGKIAAAALFALFLAQRTLEEREVYPTYPPRAFYPPIPELDPVPRGEPVRMAALGWTFAPNIAAIYGLEDARGYDAMVLGSLAQTFGLWCLPPANFYNRIEDPTLPFLAFLNVRYVLTPPGYAAPPGWKILTDTRGGRLLENPRPLPRVFVPRHLAWSNDPRTHLEVMHTIRDYANDGVAGRTRPGPLRWLDNGPAELRVASYEPERIAIAVDAAAETFVGTSIPDWRGWKLTIDGKKAPLSFFNRAFLGFEVPAGRHEAVLRYLPDGFVYGAAVTLATLALSVSLALRRPRA